MSTDTTDTDREPAYAFENRVRARLEEASQASAAAAAAERSAFDEVDRLRGDHALGLVERGRLLKGQRELARKQGEAADAAAAVRAVERSVAREREARDAVERAIANRERQSREQERAASRVRAQELWTQIFSHLDEIDRLPGLPRLSSAGRAYDAAVGGLDQLRRLFSGK
jgi:hypothetical protein